jgi:hypothetical protein
VSFVSSDGIFVSRRKPLTIDSPGVRWKDCG